MTLQYLQCSNMLTGPLKLLLNTSFEKKNKYINTKIFLKKTIKTLRFKQNDRGLVTIDLKNAFKTLN